MFVTSAKVGIDMNASEQKVELLACPFCGGSHVVIEMKEGFDPVGIVWCRTCGGQMHAKVASFKTLEQEAANRWNKRAKGNQSAIESAREALKEVIEDGLKTNSKEWLIKARQALAQLDGK